MITEKLSKGSSGDALMAFQIAFDMYESATQQFLSRVLAAIKKTAPVAAGDCLLIYMVAAGTTKLIYLYFPL